MNLVKCFNKSRINDIIKKTSCSSYISRINLGNMYHNYRKCLFLHHKIMSYSLTNKVYSIVLY